MTPPPLPFHTFALAAAFICALAFAFVVLAFSVGVANALLYAVVALILFGFLLWVRAAVGARK